MSRLALDARIVAAEIARLTEAYPELAEDADLALDMIDGETDLLPVISRAVRERAEKLAMVDGIMAYMRQLAERKARFERSGEGLKALIHGLMDAAGQDKITLPEATVFVTKPRTTVNVVDVEALPQGYFRLKKEADKDALKKALSAGEEIPGAELVLGDEGLTIRTK